MQNLTDSEGRIESLHLHAREPGGKPMSSVKTMSLCTGKGIVGNTRYYDKTNKVTGVPNRNHVSMIEREQIQDHSKTINDQVIEAGQVLSNIETTGINLGNCLNHRLRIGDTAEVLVYRTRIPCKKMDRIYPGLQSLMKHGKQGVICEVVTSGEIKIGDRIIKMNSK